MRIDLDLDLLRAFLAVSETGSFTAAAEVVGRTQSAVSQKILRLEDLIGARLFDRTSRSLALTEDGRRLLEPARRLLDLNDETVRLFRAPPVQGTLRLGVADDFIPHQLPGLLARFRRHHPGIHIDLRTGMSCDLVAAMARGELELAIAQRGASGATGRLLWREPMVWIAAAGWRAEPDRPVPLVALPAPCSYRRIAEAALADQGRSVQITCTASSLMGIQAAVRGGLGATVLGRSFVAPGLDILGAAEGWPPLPEIEIVLIGEDGAHADLAGPLVGFLTETLATPRLQFVA
ncbi:LysR substrate-binding domain-containing protein [Prosthecomicrobium hirschii]|uniref:LysR substrate-binding domain-containing protein n=1 Tax=Prosthecodimorpha hirschii TaxID=665126 RepID=UPI00221E922D|nr:LysR substrate-binding domain-containing protein [Prosthecomicrobium hirschii]MCW1840973.1 LysR substrate-binding domain-containing protein [Prosthecomicrobium hirschii]